MEGFVKLIVTLAIICAIILGIAAMLGYSCRSNPSTKELLEAPCAPYLSNGKSNQHYNNVWFDCKMSCSGIANIDFKTCDCSCVKDK